MEQEPSHLSFYTAKDSEQELQNSALIALETAMAQQKRQWKNLQQNPNPSVVSLRNDNNPITEILTTFSYYF